jgi:hypothetical protein
MIHAMHPPTQHDTWIIMKDALARACEDFQRATEQAVRLRALLESQPAYEVARAAEPHDGASYLQVLERTCTALTDMCAAYQAIGQTIVNRTAIAATSAPAPIAQSDLHRPAALD